MAADPIIVLADSGFVEGIAPTTNQEENIDWRWESKFFDFGAPLEKKKVIAVIVSGDWKDSFTVHFRADAHLDTEAQLLTGVVFPGKSTGRGTVFKTLPASLADVVVGQRLQVILKGANRTARTHIASLTLHTEGLGQVQASETI